MAITYRTSTAGGGTTGTSDRSGGAITPVANDLFIVVGNFAANTNTAPTCTDGNGGTYTLIFAVTYNGGADMCCAFVRNQPLPNTTNTTVTVATGSNTAGEILTLAFSGALRYGAAAIRQWATETGAATATPAPAFALAALTNNCTIAGCGNGTTTGSVLVPNAGWTERHDAAQASPTTGHEVATRDSGFTGTTVTAGGTSASAYAAYVIELDDRAQLAGLGLTMLGAGT